MKNTWTIEKLSKYLQLEEIIPLLEGIEIDLHGSFKKNKKHTTILWGEVKHYSIWTLLPDIRTSE